MSSDYPEGRGRVRSDAAGIAIEGPIGCLIFVVIVRAASTHSTGTQPAFYDTVAFIIGFAEQLFRDLIAKAGQLLLSSGGNSASK